MDVNKQAEGSRRFGRAAWFSLVFAILLMTASAAQALYRYSLPTDGWLSVGSLETGDWEYFANLGGAGSALRPGDFVSGIEGRPLGDYQGAETPSFWQAGNTVNFTVRRDDRELQVAVPLIHWTPRAIIQSFIAVPTGFMFFIGVAIVVSVSFLAFFKRPDDAAARALLIFAAAMAALEISELVPDGLYTYMFPVAGLVIGFFSYLIFGVLLLPSLLAFTLVFPRPKAIVLRHPWLAYSPYMLGGIVLLAYITATALGYSDAWLIGWVSTLAMVIASVVSLIHSALTMRDAISRAQLSWAIGGFVLGLGLFALNFPAAFGWVSSPWDYLFPMIANLAAPIIGLGLAMAVLRYRLFDIDVIIRRTTAYAVLTLLLALVYFGSVVLLQRLFGELTGQRSTAAVVLSTLLIAALFMPLRRRIQATIDRRFFRRKYDAAKTLEAFAATVRNETDLDALTAELARVIQETMQPEHVSVWLRPADGIRGNDPSGLTGQPGSD